MNNIVFFKNLSNLNTLIVDMQFRKMIALYVEIDICKKLNIDLRKFKN